MVYTNSNIQFGLFKQNSSFLSKAFQFFVFIYLYLLLGWESILVLFIFIVFHELNHLGMLLLYDISYNKMYLSAMSGFVEYPSVNISYLKKITIALSGSIGSIIILLGIFLTSVHFNYAVNIEILGFVLILQYLNLVPISKTDGNRICEVIIEELELQNNLKRYGIYLTYLIFFALLGLIIVGLFILIT